MQHLTTLQAAIASVESITQPQRIESVLATLRDAWTALGQIVDSGIILGTHYRTYLESMGRALRGLVEAEGVR